MVNVSETSHGERGSAERPDLQLVRDGTAYFQRALAELTDDELDQPSLLPSWSRRHVAAHVGYNAYALMNLVEWARTGVEKPMYESDAARDEQIEQGLALAPAALRELNASAAAALDSAWETLTDEAWQAEVRMRAGRAIPASVTVWMRTREVWLHAVDLDHGASFNDIPADCIDRVTANVVSTWRTRQAAEQIPNFVLAPDDRSRTRAVGDPDASDAVVIRGSAAALARWATGRGGADAVTESGAPAPTPPAWL